MKKEINYRLILVVAFTRLIRGEKRNTIKVFAASLVDINRALAVPKKESLKLKLPLEI